MQSKDPTQTLALWGKAHAAARAAERAAARHAGPPGDELRQQARLLRERADRLHRQAYLELGPTREARRD